MEEPREQDLNRREFLRAGAAGLAGAGLLGQLPSLAVAEAPPAAGAQRPNIILAMTDDQGWGDVAYNGHKLLKTPVLDEMAAGGIRFNRFYAAHPVCSPTRGSCLTGRHPNRYGCFLWGYDLPLEEISLAKAVKTAGYATGHFGKWHLGGIPTTRKGRGMGTLGVKSRFKQARHPGNHGFDEWFSYWNYFDLNPPGFHHNGKPVGPLEGEGSEITVARALEWIGKAAADKKPFFAVVWFGNPHSPHKALAKDKALYGGARANVQNYLGEVTAIDRAMGRLRKGLRDLGVAKDTMLWFTSDNGARAGSTGGLRGKKGSLWEGGVRVPGILEWPARVARPMQTDVPAGTLDYYPTTLDLLGVKMPNQVEPIDGVSLMPLIAGKMDRRPKPLPFEIRRGKSVSWAALVDGRHKLHRRKAGKAAKYELYDLVKDAAETTDVAAAEPKVVERMARHLETWQASVARSLAGKDYPPAPSAGGA